MEEFVEIDAEQICHEIGTKSWTCVIICTHKDGNNPSLVSAWQGTHANPVVVACDDGHLRHPQLLWGLQHP